MNESKCRLKSKNRYHWYWQHAQNVICVS